MRVCRDRSITSRKTRPDTVYALSNSLSNIHDRAVNRNRRAAARYYGSRTLRDVSAAALKNAIYLDCMLVPWYRPVTLYIHIIKFYYRLTQYKMDDPIHREGEKNLNLFCYFFFYLTQILIYPSALYSKCDVASNADSSLLLIHVAYFFTVTRWFMNIRARRFLEKRPHLITRRHLWR